MNDDNNNEDNNIFQHLDLPHGKPSNCALSDACNLLLNMAAMEKSAERISRLRNDEGAAPGSIGSVERVVDEVTQLMQYIQKNVNVLSLTSESEQLVSLLQATSIVNDALIVAMKSCEGYDDLEESEDEWDEESKYFS